MSTGTAVVTGGTKGIGLGYCREFLRRGFAVAFTGRGDESLDAARDRLLQELPKSADRLLGLDCDSTDLPGLRDVFETAQSRFGKVSLWLNNAGFARSGPTLSELTESELRTMVEVNLIGSFNGCQVAVAGMREQGSGHIVNTLGGGAKGQVVKGMIGYSTTKRAVKSLTECLRKELKGTPIQVSTVSPGVNITDGMLREIAQLSPDQREATIRPLNIIGDHVETTTPWLVDQLLAAKGHADVSWLTGAKLLTRFLSAPFTKRDLLSRYPLEN